MIHDKLRDLRVLVVEDELLVAMMIEEVLADQSCQVIGPFSNVGDALVAARVERIDLALLDVNVRGELVYPVAEVLAGRQIPFILLTGYGDKAAPPDHPHWPAYSKPFHAEELPRIMVSHIAG